MFGTPIIVAQASQVRTRQVHGDIVRRVGQGPAEVAGLGVVAQHDQRHAGHVPDVFDIPEVLG